MSISSLHPSVAERNRCMFCGIWVQSKLKVFPALPGLPPGACPMAGSTLRRLWTAARASDDSLPVTDDARTQPTRTAWLPRDRRSGEECRNDYSRSEKSNGQGLGLDGQAEEGSRLALDEEGGIGQRLAATRPGRESGSAQTETVTTGRRPPALGHRGDLEADQDEAGRGQRPDVPQRCRRETTTPRTAWSSWSAIPTGCTPTGN